MSETKTTPTPSSSASTPPAAAPAPKTDTMSKAETSGSTTKTTIQNGKGDAPRNISPKFRRNYDGIKWASGGKDRKEGTKVVKVYA
jgi:hypothetical protein